MDYTLKSANLREAWGVGRGRYFLLEMSDFREGDPQEVTTDDAGESRACVRPPLGHPHLGDHVTNRAFWKLSLSRGNTATSVADQ